MNPSLLLVTLSLCGLTTAFAGGSRLPVDESKISAAIGAPHRTDADRSLDESRKPREFLQFLDMRDGDKVAEINAGAGYNARLLATAVGQTGKVYASNANFVLDLFGGLNERLRESVRDVPNIAVSEQENATLILPEPVDLAILNLNYHDLHWQEIDTGVFNQSVFDALRPGGYFIIGDHQAVSGSGSQYASTLHRIDRELVIAEVEAVGFTLVARADFLSNPNDDRTLFAADPAIRGKTDRFLLKFRRP